MLAWNDIDAALVMGASEATPRLPRANCEGCGPDSAAMRLTARTRRRAIWSTVAVLAVAGAVAAVALSQANEAVPAASSTTRVQRGTVVLAAAAAGTIQSAQTRGLSFSMAGTVTELDVKAGDTVTAGQVLARIDPADAQAAADSAQSRVNDAQDAVTRAQPAATVPACPTATTAPTAARTATTAPRITPTASATRTATPSAAPSGSASARTGSGTGGQARGQTGGAAGPGGGLSQNCTSNTRASTTDSLLSAQQQLNNAELALVQAKARLAGTTITAPSGGRVLSVGGKVGAKASPGGTGFVVLGDVANLTVRAQFSEADVGRLAVGQISTIALPDRAAEFSGKVSQIDPAGTVSSKLVRYGVVIAFDSVPADLLLGQSATVTVTTGSVDNVLYVASAAVTGVANGTGTVLVRATGKDTTRTVTVGLRGDQYTEIKDGLSEGDEVVLPSST
jgi:multidrug efflux pump subunit AcrA (membrane-fusion protein)